MSIKVKAYASLLTHVAAIWVAWCGWGWLLLSGTGGGFIPAAASLGRTGHGALGVFIGLVFVGLGGFLNYVAQEMLAGERDR